jgi:hypothetical protein
MMCDYLRGVLDGMLQSCGCRCPHCRPSVFNVSTFETRTFETVSNDNKLPQIVKREASLGLLSVVSVVV